MSAALIAIDWGTTSCRAVLLDADGMALDERPGAPGILHVPDADFAAAFHRLVEAWPDVPVLLSGMIGSRQGWVEAPYVPTPAGLEELAGGLVSIPTSRRAPVRLVPGVVHQGAWPDVMRGEETQIIGALDLLHETSGTLVLPGTHSKQVLLQAGRIIAFSSFMTGEVFAALTGHTILGRLMAPAPTFDAAAFDHGVAVGAAEGHAGALLHRIFSTRTLGLFDRLAPAAASDYLSGLLIGAEVAALRSTARPIVVVGGADLAARYAAACQTIGSAITIAPAITTARGAFILARHAGLLGP